MMRILNVQTLFQRPHAYQQLMKLRSGHIHLGISRIAACLMAMDIGNPPHLVSPPSSNEIENLNKGRSEITFEMRAPTSSQQFPVSIESVTIDKKKSNDGVQELYHCVRCSNHNICS